MGSAPGELGNSYDFHCGSTADMMYVWIDDHMVCHYGVYNNPTSSFDGTPATPLRYLSKRQLPIRVHLYYLNGSTSALPITLTVQVRANGTGGYNDIPTALLIPSLDPNEVTRAALQKEAATGWGTWLPQSIFSVAHLPDAATLTFGYCNKTAKSCIMHDVIESQPLPGVVLRAGPHRVNRTYAQFYYAWYELNVSVEYWVDRAADTLDVLVTPISCSASCDDVTLKVMGSFSYRRVGQASTAILCPSYATVFKFAPYGLAPLEIICNGTALSNNGAEAHFALNNGALQFSSTPPTEDACAATRPRLLPARQPLRTEGDAEVQDAIEAAIMWNYVYVPAELGPMLPVARSWQFTHVDTTNSANDPVQFGYVLFDWDNLFASYMAGHLSREVAFTNFIQIVRAKTSNGFVPNYAAGGLKSVDRTEPPVGAMVLREMYKKYSNDTWLVELLFDDLLDWHNWFAQRRMVPGGLFLICLGTDSVSGYVDPASNAMQGARYESGLDNSPMYDGEFFNTITHQMQLYDTGMSSMVANEAFALAELAQAIGRTSESVRLHSFAVQMQQAIQQQLWDNSTSAFVNKFLNGSFYPRQSPTSFYPMMANAATSQQISETINSWLLNTSRFCLNPQWPQGNTDDCYWGLPSISADDVAFPPLGYWRGYVWGPMAQLTYWSLREADSLHPDARTARLALVNQMREMGLNMWRLNRHICENFSPHRVAQDCTGDRFYHWGALTMFLSILESGEY